MTSKKSDYYKNERNFWAMMFSILAIAFIGTAILATLEINKFKNFAASQYNFTEDECINWYQYSSISDITTSSCWSNLTELKDNVIGTILWVESRGTCTRFNKPRGELFYVTYLPKVCSLYCHTKQVQDGEVCVIEEKLVTREISNFTGIICLGKNEILGIVSRFYFINASTLLQTITEKGRLLEYNELLDACRPYVPINYEPDFNQTFGTRILERHIVNQTTCTPIYKNETYGCQSGDDVRIAKELIG